MGFSRQGHWNGLPFPSPGDLPDPGIEPKSPALWADTLPSEPPEIAHEVAKKLDVIFGIKIHIMTINHIYVTTYNFIQSSK